MNFIKNVKQIISDDIATLLFAREWKFHRLDYDYIGIFENWSKNGTHVFVHIDHFESRGEWSLIHEFGEIAKL